MKFTNLEVTAMRSEVFYQNQKLFIRYDKKVLSTNENKMESKDASVILKMIFLKK